VVRTTVGVAVAGGTGAGVAGLAATNGCETARAGDPDAPSWSNQV
jgi:hypothetical protein